MEEIAPYKVAMFSRLAVSKRMTLKQVLNVETEMPFPVAKVPDNGPQRTVALLLGVVTVLLLSGFFIAKIKHWQGNSVKTTPLAAPAEAVVPIAEGDRLATASSTVALPTSHVVLEGENLSSIAEYYYTSGNNYVDIMEANNLYSPDQIAVGQKLIIPKVPIRPVTQ